MLFTTWTLLRRLPLLRAAWASVGTAGTVLITGENAKAMLFGAVRLRTADRVAVARPRAGATRAFIVELRQHCRGWGTLWLLADRATAHVA